MNVWDKLINLIFMIAILVDWAIVIPIILRIQNSARREGHQVPVNSIFLMLGLGILMMIVLFLISEKIRSFL